MVFLSAIREQFRADAHPSTELALDDAFQLLRNSRRRHVVDYLANLDGRNTVRLRELTTYVASMECDVEPDATTRKQLKSVREPYQNCSDMA